MTSLQLSGFETFLIFAVMGIAIAGLVYAVFLRNQILKESKGSAKMQEVWNFIRVGANAYLRSQLRIITVLIAVLVVVLFFSVYVVKPTPFALRRFCEGQTRQIEQQYLTSNPQAKEILDNTDATKTFTINGRAYESANARAEVNGAIEAAIASSDLKDCNAALIVAFGRAGAFLMGAIFSAMVGFIGMNMAVQGNVRVAAAAVDKTRGYAEALRIAYRSGTITGMLTDGLGLFGGTIIFIIFGIASPDALLGFGFGGTLLALFMRVGGGIFTKAADVGADLVGKIEADLPEDDPRNAAVIADLVGDNVGDCAGMAADIFESYEVTIVSGLILGLALAVATGSLIFIVFPLIVRGIGVLCSMISTYLVKSTGETNDALSVISRSFYTAAALSIVLFTIFTVLYMRGPSGIIWQPLAACVIGIGLAIVIERVTAYFTDTNTTRFRRSQKLADWPGDRDPFRPRFRYGIKRVGDPGHCGRDQRFRIHLQHRAAARRG